MPNVKQELNQVKQGAEQTKQELGQEVDKQDPKILAAISYLWILFLIPLILKKDDQFVQHHAKQGLVLFVFSLIITLLGSIPVLGWLIIMPLGWLIVIVLALLGMVNALRGEMWKMPYLGKYAKRINL